VRRETDRAIGFQGLFGDPDAYRGRTALLGGEIIEVRNFPGNTLIFVLQRPLGLRDEPAVDKKSGGRFLVIAPGFLDPAIYRAGRKVTVVGIVQGELTRRLGDLDYRYPLALIRDIHIWTEERAGGYDYYRWDHWGWGWYPSSPWHDLYWGY